MARLEMVIIIKIVNFKELFIFVFYFIISIPHPLASRTSATVAFSKRGHDGNVLRFTLISFISRTIFPFDKGKYPKGEGLETLKKFKNILNKNRRKNEMIFPPVFYFNKLLICLNGFDRNKRLIIFSFSKNYFSVYQCK